MSESREDRLREMYAAGELMLDPDGRGALRSGRFVTLTRREFELLQKILSTVDPLHSVLETAEDAFATTIRVTMMTL